MSLKGRFYVKAKKRNASKALGKKYELLLGETTMIGTTKLYRIRALRDFGKVKAGDLGGFVESEKNLSHDGNCWIAENGKVFENARIFGDAVVSGNARVFEDAQVGGKVKVVGTAKIFYKAQLTDRGTYSGEVQMRPFTSREKQSIKREIRKEARRIHRRGWG